MKKTGKSRKVNNRRARKTRRNIYGGTEPTDILASPMFDVAKKSLHKITDKTALIPKNIYLICEDTPGSIRKDYIALFIESDNEKVTFKVLYMRDRRESDRDTYNYWKRIDKTEKTERIKPKRNSKFTFIFDDLQIYDFGPKQNVANQISDSKSPAMVELSYNEAIKQLQNSPLPDDTIKMIISFL